MAQRSTHKTTQKATQAATQQTSQQTSQRTTQRTTSLFQFEPETGRPRFTPDQIEALVLSHFGITGSLDPLPSDRDQNFRLRTESGDFVVKISNSDQRREVLEAEDTVLYRLADTDIPAPVPVAAIHGSESIPGDETGTAENSGKTLIQIQDSVGDTHWMRLQTWLPGRVLAAFRPRSEELLHDLGLRLGVLDAILGEEEDRTFHRYHDWDLYNASRTIRRNIEAIETPDRHRLVRHFLQYFETDVAPRLDSLPKQVIHGDANDYNILVGSRIESSPGARESTTGSFGSEPLHAVVTGIVDFGDLTYTVRIAEVAIAAAYAMMDRPDPIGSAVQLVAGYHRTNPLTDPELDVLFGLICARLCVSACMAAFQKKREPGVEYLTISERPAWDLLSKLHGVHPRMATARFRVACGFAASPTASVLPSWLRKHASEFAAVVSPDPRISRSVVFDFSVQSLEFQPDALMNPRTAEDEIMSRLRSAESRIGVGRYDEARLVYAGKQFRGNTDFENRTVHIGLDLIQPVGSPIFAPLDGVVVGLKDNNQAFDYGPTLILRHDPDEGPVFYTLYGHLARSLFDELRKGGAVHAGDRIAAIGSSSENGGWMPHLHFQVITDLLEFEGDFPGVALPSQRTVWKSLCPDPNLIVGIPDDAFPPLPMSDAEILDLRRRHIGSSLGLSYDKPLHIVRGFMQYLYDSHGRAYLDAVNNVPHVGHSHPRVVEAAQRQATALNTNTRYLHENLVRYASRLADTLPDGLDVVYVVNSGSEANDLALRMAYAYTGHRSIITMAGAYHGNLSSLIDISPYKYNGPGGAGCPATTVETVMPDPYRGPYRGYSTRTGEAYAAEVSMACRPDTAAFMAESLPGCGGQIVLPDTYLERAYEAVRGAGGVCIADEVQVGLGRVGSHFWGFETQNVVPDIVTIGKPVGNGHPLGAVVTTRAIADAFDTGMEYFNTFGGNPVSCAVGLAVLDVIEQEHLQENARSVGAYLLSRLREMSSRHDIIGDVRGLGLFIGIELVLNRNTLEPADLEAEWIANRMAEEGVLMSTDGPLHNVLKIKPPMVFTQKNADRLVSTLNRILEDDFVGARLHSA